MHWSDGPLARCTAPLGGRAGWRGGQRERECARHYTQQSGIMLAGGEGQCLCSGNACQGARALSVSAMKNMLSSVVEISNACGLFSRSSAPLIDRHRRTCARAAARLGPLAASAASGAGRRQPQHQDSQAVSSHWGRTAFFTNAAQGKHGSPLCSQAPPPGQNRNTARPASTSTTERPLMHKARGTRRVPGSSTGRRTSITPRGTESCHAAQQSTEP